ncbi:type II toxin-antitoxin system VapC family toxin [Candidatus Gottesmanbacteria bacterium]|nr:type II toxin-antitoxin system VapC family toxin [Candidatus Gottesmanbacteria bacterium]
MKIIVDTSILIDFSRKRKIEKEEILWPKLVGFAGRRGHQLITPAVALFELFAGEEMNKPVNCEKMENILNDVVVLDLTKEVAQKAASLFRKYKVNIGPIDYLLAATTLVLEGELVTFNPKHFKVFKDLPLFDLSKL